MFLGLPPEGSPEFLNRCFSKAPSFVQGHGHHRESPLGHQGDPSEESQAAEVRREKPETAGRYQYRLLGFTVILFTSSSSVCVCVFMCTCVRVEAGAWCWKSFSTDLPYSPSQTRSSPTWLVSSALLIWGPPVSTPSLESAGSELGSSSLGGEGSNHCAVFPDSVHYSLTLQFLQKPAP